MNIDKVPPVPFSEKDEYASLRKSG